MDLSGPIVNVAQDFLDELKRTQAYLNQAMPQAYIKTLYDAPKTRSRQGFDFNVALY